jgi:hypothetical protein
MTHLIGTLPCSRVKGTKGDTSFLPYGITYEILTYNVGLLEKQVHLIDVRQVLFPFKSILYKNGQGLKHSRLLLRSPQQTWPGLIPETSHKGFCCHLSPFCIGMVGGSNPRDHFQEVRDKRGLV